mmetsp:Transcript_5231/g.8064  ORF Transcript_5231/g.8064 Transcript_5231/m.8064 type:complete len:80 (+) Transcript_5231:458-697(+)
MCNTGTTIIDSCSGTTPLSPGIPVGSKLSGCNNNNNNNSMDRYFSVPTYNLDHPVGMRTGATIHTRYGLHMKISKRNKK